MEQARSWREYSKDTKRDEANREVCASLASELYAVCALLENTEEINPTYMELDTLFVGGMPIGEIIEREGRKWKVVDNNKTIKTRCELVN